MKTRVFCHECKTVHRIDITTPARQARLHYAHDVLPGCILDLDITAIFSNAGYYQATRVFIARETEHLVVKLLRSIHGPKPPHK